MGIHGITFFKYWKRDGKGRGKRKKEKRKRQRKRCTTYIRILDSKLISCGHGHHLCKREGFARLPPMDGVRSDGAGRFSLLVRKDTTHTRFVWKNETRKDNDLTCVLLLPSEGRMFGVVSELDTCYSDRFTVQAQQASLWEAHRTLSSFIFRASVCAVFVFLALLVGWSEDKSNSAEVGASVPARRHR